MPEDQMTPEERYRNMDRKIEFILNQQAQFYADLRNLEELTTRNSEQSAENWKQIAENGRLIADNSRLIADNGRQIGENARQIAELSKLIERRFSGGNN